MEMIISHSELEFLATIRTNRSPGPITKRPGIEKFHFFARQSNHGNNVE